MTNIPDVTQNGNDSEYEDEDESLVHMPDANILFQRYLDSRRIINVYDWFKSPAVVFEAQKVAIEIPPFPEHRAHYVHHRAMAAAIRNGSKMRTAMRMWRVGLLKTREGKRQKKGWKVWGWRSKLGSSVHCMNLITSGSSSILEESAITCGTLMHRCWMMYRSSLNMRSLTLLP